MSRSRRNRNRKTQQVRSLECTCDLRHELDTDPFEDHAGNCDLWHSEDFMNGLLEWCPVQQKLTRRFSDTSSSDDIWDEDLWDDDGAPKSDLQRIVDATVGGMSAVSGWTPKNKRPGYVSCRHNMTEVRLPDEAATVIYCSGSMDARGGGRPFRPDWAVYLCGSWNATGMSLFIPWQDYGTPWVDWTQVRWAAQDIYARALSGQRVEIGCMGGHGRTGTLLACLAQLADPNMTARGSVDWVRANYCSKAVEDESQRYFTEWFADPTLAPVWVEPFKVASAVTTTVVGPKVSGGTACNWSRNGTPCTLPLNHNAPHFYPAATVGAAVAQAKAAPVESAGVYRGITMAEAIEQASK